MASEQKFARTILIDEPSSEDQFHGKGHERTATALARAITSLTGKDRAIGLDGPWGSGKSTVVEIARTALTTQRKKGGAEYRFFTFDIWQSQGSSFRRSFLEHFLDWTLATFPTKRAQLEAIERDVKGKVRQVQSKSQSILDWWGVLVIAAIPFLPIYYFWAKAVFDDTKREEVFTSTSPMWLLYVFVLLTLGWAAWKCWRESEPGAASWVNFPSRYRQALSQTLLINSKQFEDQKVTQYIRETDPNDFEFQTSLRRVLSVVQSRDTKIVIVLDNIDRLPRKEINEYWAQVRAVFSNGPSKSREDADSSVIAIVPYDRHLVEGVSKPESNGDAKGAAISSLGTREIFSKTFDEILQVSPPVMSNSRDFFLEKIAKALPNATNRDELFRVYLVFDHILRHENGNATPRQIIAFINELTGMYILHEGRFRMPTVAVYIAHADSLEANPGLLNDPGSLDAKLRALAADPELEQNLAAMIFNVEPTLALQLLLDDRIKTAASRSADSLMEISKAPGFDLRVDSVIQENFREWEKGEVFPFIISNFADLAQSYDGDSRAHFCKSLVAAVMDLGTIQLTSKVYEPVLRIFDIARPEERAGLAKAIAKAASNDWGNEPTLATGQSWAAFVGELNRRLARDGSAGALREAMGGVSFPTSPEFLFGLASSVAEEGFSLSQLKITKPDMSKDGSVFSTLAVQHPAEARDAFLALRPISLVTTDHLTAVFAALVAATGEAEIEDFDHYRDQIDLLAEIYAYVPAAKRGDLSASPLFGQSRFYTDLRGCMKTPDDASLGSAIFLATLEYGKDGPPAPTTRGANGGRVSDQTEDFNWFSKAFADAKVVSVEQFRRAAYLTKLGNTVTKVVEFGASAPDNTLLAGIVRYAFAEGSQPLIALPNTLLHYDYIRIALGQKLETALGKYASRASNEEIDKLQLAEIPLALVRDIKNQKNPEWQLLIEKVKTLLRAIPIEDWIAHLTSADDISRILWEVADGSEFEFADPAFREVYVELILGLLAGRHSVADTDRHDLLLGTIGSSFHSDVLRSIREQMRDVNSPSLAFASKVVPQTLSKLVSGADRLTKQEKDNLVRFILCPALEGAIEPILADFETLGRAKVKDMIAQAEESTKEKLNGASAVFSTASADRDWTKRISELLHGKRKSKSLFDFWYRKADDNEEE
ncbi:KAP family NTPase [Pararhizobium sp. BT-229]|uniref:KAP family NTPase n=1 Tax=Pararhizobium sp. BT-229 TaxID=2986923 RepID=UPI0021F7C62A|nr:KAP family NTPase [Pararhizobium sp. BT-229]MCV9960292.1 KAP family NTPase [Pararhizobium sp. BT-229]